MTSYPDIFVSYRRSDGSAFAEGITLSLRSKGYTVFFDKQSIKAGAAFPTVLGNAIEHAKEMILIVTPDYFGKIHAEHDWVRKELQEAVRNQSLNIFPILIDCDPPERNGLPRGLKSLSSCNFIRYNQSFDTYEKVTDELISLFHDETKENARIGEISERLRTVDVSDNRQFNVACKDLIGLLKDEHGHRALLHILENRKNLYPQNYRYAAFYTLFSYNRRMHEARKLIDLVEKYGQEFVQYPFTNYVFMEYYQVRFNLEIDSEKIPAHLLHSLEYAGRAVKALQDNNGVIHSYCLAAAAASENGVTIPDKDFKKAEELIDVIIRKDPDYALYYCTKARLQAVRGKYKEALMNLKLAEALERPVHDDWILRIAGYYKFEAEIRSEMIMKENKKDTQSAS